MKPADANDVLQRRGEAELRRLFDNAAGKSAQAAQQLAAALEFAGDVEVNTKADDIVKGILPRGVTGALYGPSGAGKTFATLDLAFHVALGRDWHGRRVRKAVPVLYVGLEGVPGLRHRMVACRSELGDPGKMLARLTVPVLLNQSDFGTAGQAQIVDAARTLADLAGERIGLIIVDTVARAMAGDDENSARDMSAFVGRLDAIARETGAAVLCIHHPGKDESRGMRGNYALGAACDVVLKIDVRDDGTRSVAAEKVRDGEIGDLFSFKLRPVTLGTDDDGDQITSCVVVPCEATSAPKRGRPKGSAKELLGLRALKMAIDEVGSAPPGSAYIPQDAGARVVTFAQLKLYAAKLGIFAADDKPKRQNEVLRRVMNALVAKNQVGQDGDYLWLIR
jgi:hypothetical protein